MSHTRPTAARSVPLSVPVLTEQTGPKRSHPGRLLATGASSVTARARVLDHAASQVLRPVTLPVLRVVLGFLFVWFGGLKVMGVSPVAGLVSQTLPFANPHLVVLGLGTAEVALGLVLMTGRFLRCALPVLVVHLAGTFSTFAVVPHLMFRDGNPLLLTSDGEFVMKNVILIAGTLVLISHTSQITTKRHPGLAAPL
jgi:putative oxidoreductase